MHSATEIGNIIKNLRGTDSLREFAKKCDVSHTAIDTIEKGYDFRTGKPVQTKLATLEKIATACGVPLSHITGTPSDKKEISDYDIQVALFGEVNPKLWKKTKEYIAFITNYKTDEYAEFLKTFKLNNNKGDQKMLRNRLKCIMKLSVYGDQIEWFASKYDVSVEDITKWKNQEEVIPYEFAEKIAKDNKVPIEFIYGFDFKIKKPVNEWDESYIQDMERENDECKDYCLFRFGGGEFYKSQNEMQEAINKLLGVEDTYYEAAQSTNNQIDRFTKKRHEFTDKLENAPEQEDPLE